MHLRVLIYSPVLEAVAILEKVGVPHGASAKSVLVMCMHLDDERCKLSKGNWVRLLELQKTYSKGLDPETNTISLSRLLAKQHGIHEKAQLTVKVSQARVPYEFHKFGSEAVYAAFPMHRDRTSFNELPLLHAYPAIRDGQMAVVRKFHAEFEQYWKSPTCVEFPEYYAKHEALILDLLAMTGPRINGTP